jgi:uncharacterized protein (TIGR03437 family)
MQKERKLLTYTLAGALMASGLAAQVNLNVNVLTANYNNARTNANLNETILSTLNVNSTQFGKLFSLPVNGAINTQPLYVQGLTIPNAGTHNVVYVGTHSNDVYAFDADTQGNPLWQVNLGTPVPGTDFNVADLTQIGILGTPVIDITTNTLYVVAFTKENGNHVYRLHALDITTGAEKFGGPTLISATVPGNYNLDSVNGQIAFNASDHLQRPGLALLKNTVYIGFGSHDDTGVWHGWLMGYNAANLQQVSVSITTPNGWGASIWQGGRAPAIDDQGNIYVGTGNGAFDTQQDYGESFLKFSTSTGIPTLADWFTPDNYSTLNDKDNDLGSCGPVLSRLGWLIGGGKEGVVYLIDQNNLGHTQAGNGQILQQFQAIGFGIYNMAFWDRLGGPMLYLRADADVAKAFQIIDNQFQTTPVSQSTVGGALPYDGMAISANGSAAYSGIFWITITQNGNSDGAGTLHAFSALNLEQELWNSNMNASRDALGTLAKFTAPTVVNGKVYVPNFSGSLMVYGLLSQKAAIGEVANAASGYTGPVAPGEMVAIFGTDLGSSALVTDAEVSTTPGKLSYNLNGTQVLINGTAAPLLYARTDQVAAVVPYGVSSQKSLSLQVQYQGQGTATVQIPVAATAPGLFTVSGAGSGQGAILNQDTSLNSAANPALRGSIVALYGTGQGQTDPSGQEDEIPGDALATVVSPVTVTIGGQPAELLYAGTAPTLAGLMQINVRVPTGINPGSAVPVVVTIGGVSSQHGVTIAVQ